MPVNTVCFLHAWCWCNQGWETQAITKLIKWATQQGDDYVQLFSVSVFWCLTGIKIQGPQVDMESWCGLWKIQPDHHQSSTQNRYHSEEQAQYATTDSSAQCLQQGYCYQGETKDDGGIHAWGGWCHHRQLHAACCWWGQENDSCALQQHRCVCTSCVLGVAEPACGHTHARWRWSTGIEWHSTSTRHALNWGPNAFSA